jgi:hypothetical protein
MFMKYGGLTVDNLDGHNKMGSCAELKTLKVIGSVLVSQDRDKIWEYDNGTFAGLNCVYTKDERFFNNQISPPGVPFPRALDEERSDQYASNYMWVFAPGKWYNKLEFSEIEE